MTANKGSRSEKNALQASAVSQAQEDGKLPEQRTEVLKSLDAATVPSLQPLLPLESQETWTCACHLKFSFRFTGIGVKLLFPDLSHYDFACVGGKAEKNKHRPHLAELTSPDLHGQTAWDQRSCL